MKSKFEFVPPMNYQEKDANIFFFNYRPIPILTPSVRKCCNQTIHIGTGPLQTGFKRIAKLFLGRLGIKYKTVFNNNPVVIITDGYSSNYYHWLSEALPKLVLLREQNVNAQIVLKESYHNVRFVGESLDLIECKYCYYSNNVLLKVPQLYLPEMTANSGLHHPFYFCEMKNWLINNVGLNKRKPKVYDIVFINRGKAGTRQISNWDEIEKVLIGEKVHIVILEMLSLREQIILMQQTNCLIGVHGAGLSNMCFMKENSKVVEIRREDDLSNYCYFNMASICSIN